MNWLRCPHRIWYFLGSFACYLVTLDTKPFGHRHLATLLAKANSTAPLSAAWGGICAQCCLVSMTVFDTSFAVFQAVSQLLIWTFRTEKSKSTFVRKVTGTAWTIHISREFTTWKIAKESTTLNLRINRELYCIILRYELCYYIVVPPNSILDDWKPHRIKLWELWPAVSGTSARIEFAAIFILLPLSTASALSRL